VRRCVDIIADERVAAGARDRLGPGRPDEKDGAWCTLCGREADLGQALLVEDRALLCGPCVNAVALAADVAERQPRTRPRANGGGLVTWWRKLVSVSIAAAASCACSEGNMPSAPSSEALRLVAFAPASGVVLTRGGPASVSLTVESASPGRLTLSVRDQSGSRLLSPEPSTEVAARRETSIQASFAVPATASAVDVFAEFRPFEATPATVIHVAYVAR
jgi:hypothetical protein